MKNNFFLLFVLMISCNSFAQDKYPPNLDSIYWQENYKLTWDDFLGTPDTTSIYGANTVSGFITKSKYTSDTTICVVVSAVFYKKKSYQKKQYQTSQSLKHEQCHFDITEIFARKVTTAFTKYKYSKETVNKDIDSIVNYYFIEMNNTQRLYDEQTSNHRNFTKQKEWNLKIEAWLKKDSK